VQLCHLDAVKIRLMRQQERGNRVFAVTLLLGGAVLIISGIVDWVTGSDPMWIAALATTGGCSAIAWVMRCSWPMNRGHRTKQRK
jgi:Flp pilus assembly protein TadB